MGKAKQYQGVPAPLHFPKNFFEAEIDFTIERTKRVEIDMTVHSDDWDDSDVKVVRGVVKTVNRAVLDQYHVQPAKAKVTLVSGRGSGQGGSGGRARMEGGQASIPKEARIGDDYQADVGPYVPPVLTPASVPAPTQSNVSTKRKGKSKGKGTSKATEESDIAPLLALVSPISSGVLPCWSPSAFVGANVDINRFFNEVLAAERERCFQVGGLYLAQFPRVSGFRKRGRPPGSGYVGHIHDEDFKKDNVSQKVYRMCLVIGVTRPAASTSAVNASGRSSPRPVMDRRFGAHLTGCLSCHVFDGDTKQTVELDELRLVSSPCLPHLSELILNYLCNKAREVSAANDRGDMSFTRADFMKRIGSAGAGTALHPDIMTSNDMSIFSTSGSSASASGDGVGSSSNSSSDFQRVLSVDDWTITELSIFVDGVKRYGDNLIRVYSYMLDRYKASQRVKSSDDGDGDDSSQRSGASLNSDDKEKRDQDILPFRITLKDVIDMHGRVGARDPKETYRRMLIMWAKRDRMVNGENDSDDKSEEDSPSSSGTEEDDNNGGSDNDDNGTEVESSGDGGEAGSNDDLSERADTATATGASVGSSSGSDIQISSRRGFQPGALNWQQGVSAQKEQMHTSELDYDYGPKESRGAEGRVAAKVKRVAVEPVKINSKNVKEPKRSKGNPK